MSVVQGSTLSCLLYMIYTLDLPLLCLPRKLSMEEEINDTSPKSVTYVDDTTNTSILNKQTSYQTMELLTDYMRANYLTLNQSKTQLLIMSKNINTKQQLKIETETGVELCAYSTSGPIRKKITCRKRILLDRRTTTGH